MTISAETIQAGPFNGNDSTDVFAITFKCFSQSDLNVVLTNSSGVESTKTITTHYTVSLNSNQDSSPGGSVTMVTPPATGEKITIINEPAFTQGVDLVNGGGFFPNVIEDAIDRNTILGKRARDTANRSVIIPVSDSTGTTTELPTETLRASKAVVFDSSGNVGVSTDDYEDQVATVAASATAAAGSATSAATSATAAATSATAAATSATAAATSATAAAGSATSAASDAVDTAADAVSTASDAVDTAADVTSSGTNATNAASSASTATTQASAASTSATAAATSATSAATSATTATTQASAASTQASAASTSAAAAAASYDNFDDRWLGDKASDPSVDNDGNSLLDGAAYFNTTNNVLMVYDLGGTTWNRTTPTSSDQTKINTVSGIQANVTTVAGISSNVTTVAGISSNVTTVAGISSDVTAVAADATDIGAVAAKATEIGRLGTADAVADMAILGTADVVTDMNTLGTADVVADMNTLGTADVVSDMNTLATADVVTDMNTLGTADVVADMNTLGTADVVADMNTLGTADVVNDMNVLGTSGNVTNMNTLSGISANITSVAGIAANVTTVAGISANVTTVATNEASVNRYSDEYTIASSVPGSPSEGDLWYDSTNNVLKVHNGSTFVAVTSATAGIASVADDSTPELGGDLSLNGNNIDFPTTANVSDCIDDDTFGTASATKLATSESIKAYVDAIEASEITTAGVTFSNYNTIAGNTTTTTATTKNMFLMGSIAVTGTAVWTIAGNGVLTII